MQSHLANNFKIEHLLLNSQNFYSKINYYPPWTGIFNNFTLKCSR